MPSAVGDTETGDARAARSFPVLGPRPPARMFRRAAIEIPFDGSFLETLGAVAVVLARHNEAERVVVGCPRIGPDGPEPESVGLGVAADARFTDVLDSARSALGDDCRGDDGDARVFVAGLGEPNAGSGSVEAVHLDRLRHTLSSTDLDLIADRREGVLRCGFDVQLVDEVGARRLLEQVVRAALESREKPDRPVAELDLLGEEERRALLSLDPPPFPPPTDRRCIHERIEARAAAIPESVAASFGAARLSYGALDRLANRLACRLREAGVERGDRVGIRLDRSLELLVAIHGVLKTGAAYVPVEPQLPPARQRRIRELAGLGVVVGSEGDEPLPDARQVSVGSLDDDAAPQRPAVASEPGDTAYVLFTSGSTGTPKGVAISHEQVTQLFEAAREHFSFSSDDVWMNAHTFAFDASVWEIFGALLHGGSVAMASRETTRDPGAMVDLIQTASVTMLTTTPTAFDGLRDVALEGEVELRRLRYVVLCAEALNPAALAPWFESRGDEQPKLVNMYGITETTVHSTFHPLSWEDARSPRRRIGRGLPDTPLRVLDPRGRLVPFGVPGEIHVGGGRVAAGYFSAGEDDQARFARDPFAADPSARMYRSGDRGRWLPDGTLEYLGRLDHQVKVRGYRIELGEIEHALLDHPGVRSARAWAIHSPERPPTLAAYYVPVSPDAGEATDLREHLATRLPDYMVPAHFVPVDELPLTENAKLDVARLPDPLAGREPVEPDQAAGSPLSAVEALLTRTMADVLGVAEIAPDASFFELGGDSITAVRLVGRLRREGLGVELPQVYELRTARLLAQALKAGPAAEAVDPRPFSLIDEADARWLPDGAVDAYPTSRLQRGLLFHNAVDRTAYHDVLSYTVGTHLEEGPLREALEAAVAAHPALRTSFVVEGPSVPLQVVHPTADVACSFVHADGSDRGAAFLDRWAREERDAPFDWRVPGLLRICVYLRADGRSVLSLSVHHAILDGWSAAMLVTELLLGYAKVRAGEVPEARPDGHLLRRVVTLEKAAEESEEHRRFWREALEDADPAEVGSRGAGAAGGSNGGEVRMRIPPEGVEGLRRTARRADVPLKTVYLAAHLALMSYVSGKPDVVTGLVVGTRVEDEGGDEALGLFLNTLPIRAQPGEADWTALVRRVFDLELAAYRHRRYPFERIQADANTARLCLTGFNYTDFHIYRELASAGLSLEEVRYREKTDFQLLLTVSEDPEDLGTSLTVSYDAGVDRERAECIARLFLELVEAAASAGDRPVLGSLAEWARGAGLTFDPPTAAAEEAESPLLAVIERTRDCPTATAQEHEGASESFAELGARVSRVREVLVDLGVTPGARVACFLDRGLDPLAAMLGIWAAGATYVPVDVSLPVARQAKMIELAAPAVAIASSRLYGGTTAWGGDVAVLDGSLGPAASGTESWRIPDPAEEAYVLFTSGSTGVPKGVSMPHRGLANLISWQARQPELAAPRRISQFAALSFDVSIQEMLAAATTGGTLCVVPEEAKPNPQALLELLARQEVELCFLPVVALQQLAAAWEILGVTPPALRWTITAGEALIVSDAIREFCRATSTELVNQYGPTETHVATHYRLGGNVDEWPERPPIGLPIANVTARVLDHAGRPVPRGTPGQLHLGGACVATGYVDGPELDRLTGERFVRPAGEDGILYRTGDVVRGGDGGLEFVGRADDQVKVRGHRVELGEVSAVLLRHPSVRSCAVRPHEGAGGHALVAYVVGEGDEVSPEELIEHARTTLPDYAVPSQVQVISELPKTKSGKLDAKALPPPRRPRPTAKAVPLSSTERRVLEIWRQVLDRPVASPTVSFFDAGGDSLMTLRLYGLVRNAFGEELAMHDLFRFPTARSFAAYLDGRTGRIRSVAVERSRLATSDQIASAAARNRAARAGRGPDD